MLTVKVIPHARLTRVERDGAGGFIVRVPDPPEDGRANAAMIEALAQYLGVPKRRLAIVRGHTSRRKVIRLLP